MTVVGVDRREDVDAGRLREAGVEVVLGADNPELLDGVDLLVKSPGVPPAAPLVAAGRERGLTIWSEVELGFRLLDNPILGVTGTNGKTTTSELLGEIFRAAGKDVAVAGNVGRPLSGLDGALGEDAWIVCELSSFQLEDIDTFRPRVAVLLNLAPDHLDRHASLDDYRAAKLRIFENQTAEDVAIVPRGFGRPGGSLRASLSKTVEVLSDSRICCLEEGRRLFPMPCKEASACFRWRPASSAPWWNVPAAAGTRRPVTWSMRGLERCWQYRSI